MRSRTLAGLLTAVALVLLTACTSTPETPAAPAAAVDAAHEPADVAFAQGMIPHHRQAVAMSRLAESRAASPQVKDLAARIEGEQGPEIEQMTAMLTAWGAPVPAGDEQPMAMAGMPGMMGPQQMADLGALSGPAFDRAFLTMMIAHHTGAVQMAQAELAQGTNPQARELAQAIIGAQQAEIAEMQRLLQA
ncbi:DUF305 domain-containing protein [Actinomycetospora soli]|uniref:DUF305 domain-containing protein n=1 Tax=Actinomycetospora soli TaxID=2893887 RepID=UPI001E4B3549|nr:DUF305 domain-containing protein [Actinomycetospora soli]MCD2186975.1 DUF305 domain-containing protein [Actinomycetospora soli]